MITDRTMPETPQAKRRHEEPTRVDAFAPTRAALERWQHTRAPEPEAAELPAEHEESAPRVFL